MNNIIKIVTKKNDTNATFSISDDGLVDMKTVPEGVTSDVAIGFVVRQRYTYPNKKQIIRSTYIPMSAVLWVTTEDDNKQKGGDA